MAGWRHSIHGTEANLPHDVSHRQECERHVPYRHFCLIRTHQWYGRSTQDWTIRDFMSKGYWEDRDILIVDTPPGTGDEPLTVMQLIPEVDGAIIVTSPQKVALMDSRKSVNFAKQLEIPVFGIIENMTVSSVRTVVRKSIYSRWGWRADRTRDGRALPWTDSHHRQGGHCQ